MLQCVCIYCVCVCVFIKLHITAQPGSVKLIFQCYSNGSAPWGISGVCVCVWSSLSVDWSSTGYGCCQSCSWSAEQGNLFFRWPCSCQRVWSRELGSAVPSRLNLVLTYGTLLSLATFRYGLHLNPHAASDHTITYRWLSLPRILRHRAR